MVAVVWVLALCALSVAAGVASISSWTALVALVLIPVVVWQRLRQDPAQTMSECIIRHGTDGMHKSSPQSPARIGSASSGMAMDA